MHSQIDQQLNRPLESARSACAAMIAAEKALISDVHILCEKTWEFGSALLDLREMVRHGNWQFFVCANFPELGESDESRARAARYAMEFTNSNPAKRAEDSPVLPEGKRATSPVLTEGKRADTPSVFSVDSIRKCIFRITPSKERPQLEGDQLIRPATHPLTFVNNFLKWDRQAEIGLVSRPPVDVLRTDLEPVVKRIIELAGSEWIQGLL